MGVMISVVAPVMVVVMYVGSLACICGICLRVAAVVKFVGTGTRVLCLLVGTICIIFAAVFTTLKLLLCFL